MPFAALALALLVLSGPAAAHDAAKSSLLPATSQSLMLAFDDEAYGNRNDDDEESVPPADRDYGYDNDDDGDDSAHGPADDDDGWDIDEYEHSERA
jgi:hypothetical protein